MNQIENFIKIVKAKQELMTKESNKMNDDFKLLMLKIKLGINDEIKMIDGFENYCVSDDGDVYNLTSGRKLKPYLKGKTNNQYYAISLYKDCNEKRIKIHRLVALAFIFNDDPNLKKND